MVDYATYVDDSAAIGVCKNAPAAKCHIASWDTAFSNLCYPINLAHNFTKKQVVLHLVGQNVRTNAMLIRSLLVQIGFKGSLLKEAKYVGS
eukprot:3371696-Heterocapsa_arctica.AAC.1